MTRRLVVHLGDFKTGSTAIQDWLARHGAGRGILWPATNHAPLAESLKDPAATAERFAALAADLEASPLPLAVVSAEHFEFARPDRLHAALERHLPGVEATLVAYVRPHAEALLARYAESVKIGNFTGGLAGYLDLPATGWRLSYAARFGRWRDGFGDRFRLRLYRRQDFPGGDVIRDFLQAATGDDPGPLPAPQAANPTPGLADLALLLALHRAIGPLPDGPRQQARWTLGRHIGRQLAAAARPDRPLHLDRALAEDLAARFAADAEATDRAFFAGRPLSEALQAALARAPAEPARFEPEDLLSPETRAVAALWGEMLRAGLGTEAAAGLLDRLYHE